MCLMLWERGVTVVARVVTGATVCVTDGSSCLDSFAFSSRAGRSRAATGAAWEPARSGDGRAAREEDVAKASPAPVSWARTRGLPEGPRSQPSSVGAVAPPVRVGAAVLGGASGAVSPRPLLLASVGRR